jgi:hypothetical protein
MDDLPLFLAAIAVAVLLSLALNPHPSGHSFCETPTSLPWLQC